jgi:RNA polymerase II elongation factor ELL
MIQTDLQYTSNSVTIQCATLFCHSCTHPTKGISIGNTLFSVKPPVEDVRHALYLRTSAPGRTNVPLKLYAHITGKLEVQKTIGQDLTDKLRKTTTEAAEQHMNRRTILIDTPPETPAAAKRRKEPLKKPVKQPDLRPALTQDSVPPLRARLIHYVAIAQRTSDEVVKAVGGSDYDSTRRRDILALLDQVCP